jgi:hypothetical protein
MSRIDIKTTGQLIDEYIIAKIKAEKKIDGAEARKRQLALAIRQRTNIIVEAFSKDIRSFADPRLQELFVLLAAANRLCWYSQDIVMQSDRPDMEVAEAAKQAQKSNAGRNVLIREIDHLFGEDGNTFLEKNYHG